MTRARDQRVRLRRRSRDLHPLGSHPPRRGPPLDDLGLHPGGERLVEPDVVPPGRGDQISEPLVGELVGRHLGVPPSPRRPLLVGPGERERLGEGDQAHVLHRPELHGEGDGQHVELLVRVGDAEVLLESLEELRCHPCRPGRLEAPPPRGDDPDRDVLPSRGPGLGDLERPHPERHEVRGQGTGLPEADVLQALPRWGLAHHRGVGHGHQPDRDAEGDLPGDLGRGVVHAGECAAGVGLLELGEDVPVTPALLPEDARVLLGELRALEAEGQRQWTGRELSREAQRQSLVLEGDGLGPASPRCRPGPPPRSISSASALSHTTSVGSARVASISVVPLKLGEAGRICRRTRWAAGLKVVGSRRPGGSTSAGDGAGLAVAEAMGGRGAGAAVRSAAQARRTSNGVARTRRGPMKGAHSAMARREARTPTALSRPVRPP